MKTALIRISPEVRDALIELRHDFRVWSVDEVIRVLLAKEGVEEFETELEE